jgi:hypothetical protein
MNGLEVKASDVMNAYLTALCKKVWTILGAEFGGDAGKKATFIQWLKSAGASIGQYALLGYSPCKADPGIWMKETI